MFLKPRYVRQWSLKIYTGTLVVLVCSLVFGISVQNLPYISLGPVNVSVADLSVIMLVVSLAGTYDRFSAGKQVFIGCVLSYVPFSMLFHTGALYPAVLLLVAMISMMIASREYGYRIVAFVIPAMISFFVGGRHFFISPENFEAVSLSEKHTDFIFHHVQTQHSFLALGIVLAYSIVLIRLIVLTGEVKNSFARSICVGGTAVFSVGITWGILANLGCLPMPSAGLNLPLVSYGGSLVLGHMLIAGLILGASRRKSMAVPA